MRFSAQPGLPPPLNNEVRPLKDLTVNLYALAMVCPDHRHALDTGDASQWDGAFKDQTIAVARVIGRYQAVERGNVNRPIIGSSAVVDARCQTGIKALGR